MLKETTAKLLTYEGSMYYILSSPRELRVIASDSDRQSNKKTVRAAGPNAMDHE